MGLRNRICKKEYMTDDLDELHLDGIKVKKTEFWTPGFDDRLRRIFRTEL